MKYLYKNKYWELNEDYNLDKILYLLIDKPIFITSFNDFIWVQNNTNEWQWHRDYDLPTFICSNGYYVCWYINDKCHRENNKPAKIFADG